MGVIIGASIGGFFGLLILIAIICCLCRRYGNKNQVPNQDTSTMSTRVQGQVIITPGQVGPVYGSNTSPHMYPQYAPQYPNVYPQTYQQGYPPTYQQNQMYGSGPIIQNSGV